MFVRTPAASQKTGWRLNLSAIALAFLLAVIPTSVTLAGGTSAEWDPSVLKGKVTEFTLENGLRFIVLERHDVPVFSFMTHVDAGSVDEPVGQTGLAHMFEHMAFKGTKEIGTKNYGKEEKLIRKIDELFMELYAERNKGERANPERIQQLEMEISNVQDEAQEYVEANEFSQIIDRNGGVGLNASTGADGTYYYYSLPSNRLELWAYLESARFTKPVFREFYKERDVVIEERNMRIDSQPFGQFIEEMVGVAYRAHPYKSLGIGHRADLDNLRRDVAEWYFDTYYTPQNMVVAIVGDVYPDEVQEFAKNYFGKIERRPDPAPVHTVEPEQKGERRFVLQGDTQPIFAMGFHRPNITHEDEAKIEVLARILGQGRTSRLYKRCVKEEKSALFAGAFPAFPGEKYPSLFVVFAIPNADNTPEQIEEAGWEEIKKLQTDLVSQEELDRVKTEVRAQFIRGIESNSGLAGRLAEYEVLQGGWEKLFERVDQIEAVTREDVRETAIKYLTRNNATIGYMVTEDREAKSTEMASN
ncbi:MAG: insulinase family protein [Candidatus Latescibacterota bacterium]|nr:MAG: insulinase family protein [Candidatus Latescibacterota bacterium]